MGRTRITLEEFRSDPTTAHKLALIQPVDVINKNGVVVSTISRHPYEKDKEQMVRDLGETVGFGYMMVMSSKCWGEKLKEEYNIEGGEFAVGPCVGQTVPCVCVDNDDNPGECGLCAGCRWLTKTVRTMVETVAM